MHCFHKNAKITTYVIKVLFVAEPYALYLHAHTNSHSDKKRNIPVIVSFTSLLQYSMLCNTSAQNRAEPAPYITEQRNDNNTFPHKNFR